MKLKNKVIVITWASDGIGKEIALRLAQEGSKLALIARDEKKLSDVSGKAKELGAADVKFYPCDIRQTSNLAKVIKSIISDFNGVDILINNAGIWQKVIPIDEIEESIVDDIIATNLSAVIHTTRLLLPTLRTRDEAAIINVISKSWIIAQEGQSVYTASKYGVHGFTEVLKADLKNTKIKVAGVYQSWTNTKMFEKAWETFPTDNFTNPSDLADIIAYMLSRPDKIRLHDVRVEK